VDGLFNIDYFALVCDEKGLVARGRAARYGAILAALAPWHESKGVYWFDPELLAALEDTTLDADIPVQVLLRLPEWCMYVATPGGLAGEAGLRGFYAHPGLDRRAGPAARLRPRARVRRPDRGIAWAELRAAAPTLPAAPEEAQDLLNELVPVAIALRGDAISAALYAEERARADRVAESLPSTGTASIPTPSPARSATFRQPACATP